MIRSLSRFLKTSIITVIFFLACLTAYSDYPNIRINDDTTTEIQNEQQIIANPLDPDNLVAVWRDFRLGYRQIGIGASFDGGVTWTQQLLQDPHYIWESDPGVTVDSAGNFFIVFLGFYDVLEPNGLFIQKSVDGGLMWSESTAVIDGVSGQFQDKELMACDRTGSIHDGNLYVVWAQVGHFDIVCSRSVDGGQSFEAPVQLDSRDNQWPLPAVGSNGEVYVAWVSSNPAGVHFCRSNDAGVTFTTPVPIDSEADVMGDLINGGITVFSCPAMDADISNSPHRGRVHVVYMCETGTNGMDLFYRYSDDAGDTWSNRVRLNDDPTGIAIDQFHPWLAVHPDSGEVAVMFYDRRNDPDNLLMDVYWTRSGDGGLTWSPNERVTTVSSDPTAGSKTGTGGSQRAGLLGEYNGICAAGNAWNLVWTDTRLGDQDTFTAPIIPGTPTVTPTQTRTPTPTLTPTATPLTTGVTITMPAHWFAPGDPCNCTATVANAEMETLSGFPVFLVLDVFGAYYYAPGFTSEFDYYPGPWPAGVTSIAAIPGFFWPDTGSTASGLVWYSALTDPDVSTIVGSWDSWEFGWE